MPGSPGAACHHAGRVAVINFWPPFEQIAYLALVVMGCAALGFSCRICCGRRCSGARSRPSRVRLTGGGYAVKCLGLAGSLFFVALLYWLFPEYHQGGQFYGNYYAALKVLLPAWAVLSVPLSTGSTGACRSPWMGCGRWATCCWDAGAASMDA